jgi:hypothetical protein
MISRNFLVRWLDGLMTRRAAPRTPSSVTIEWQVFGSQVRHRSFLGDLSSGGAFVRAADPRPVGSPIVLDLPTAQGPVNVHARVAWMGAQGMGLRFTRPLAGIVSAAVS